MIKKNYQLHIVKTMGVDLKNGQYEGYGKDEKGGFSSTKNLRTKNLTAEKFL